MKNQPLRDYDPPLSQIAFKFPRDIYMRFKGGCIARDTSPNRLLAIWIERQVEAWDREQFADWRTPEESPNNGLHDTP